MTDRWTDSNWLNAQRIGPMPCVFADDAASDWLSAGDWQKNIEGFTTGSDLFYKEFLMDLRCSY